MRSLLRFSVLASLPLAIACGSAAGSDTSNPDEGQGAGGAAGAAGGAGGSSAGSAGSTVAGAGGSAGTAGTGISSGGSGGVGDPACADLQKTAEVFAHSPDVLYRLDPGTGLVTEVGKLSCTDSVIDLALDKTGQIYATTATSLVKVDKITAKCTPIASGTYPNSLSFVPAGSVYPDKEALVGYNGGTYVVIDPVTGKLENRGSLPSGYESSGDIVSVKGGGTYLTIKGADCGDCLVEVDPANGTMKNKLGKLSYGSVFGLAFWAGVAYGFTSSGKLFSFDVATAKTTEIPIPGAPAGLKFWGAGSTTCAPPLAQPKLPGAAWRPPRGGSALQAAHAVALRAGPLRALLRRRLHRHRARADVGLRQLLLGLPRARQLDLLARALLGGLRQIALVHQPLDVGARLGGLALRPRRGVLLGGEPLAVGLLPRAGLRRDLAEVGAEPAGHDEQTRERYGGRDATQAPRRGVLRDAEELLLVPLLLGHRLDLRAPLGLDALALDLGGADRGQPDVLLARSSRLLASLLVLRGQPGFLRRPPLRLESPPRVLLGLERLRTLSLLGAHPRLLQPHQLLQREQYGRFASGRLGHEGVSLARGSRAGRAAPGLRESTRPQTRPRIGFVTTTIDPGLEAGTGTEPGPQRARHLPGALVERILARGPLPVADAVAALCAADTPREERDRVVEAFRAVLRWVATLALAARAQFGPPGADARDAADVSDLLRALARRGLTDGQWLALARQLLRPYAAQPETHALPALVRAIHDPRGRALALFDALLAMRKLETVAHGSTGSDDDVEAQLARRVPQLAELLTLLEPSLSSLRLVVPQAGTDKVRLYMGSTPPRGRFRRVELALPPHVTRGEPLLVDDEGRPVLALAPLALVRPASAGEVDEVWVADGGRKDALRYVAIPSMAEHVEPEGLRAIEARIALHVGDEAGEEIAGATRPYRGLASFGPEHASLFFGREEETESLANRIRKSPLVTVTGPSGAGKSSLLSAGVIPKLAGFVPIVVRPGADPAVALSRRLAEELGEPGSVATIARTVREAPEAAALALARFAAERGRGIVLMVDQAEELFTLTADAEARLSFARFLAVAGADEDGPVRVVLVVREDFFARLTTLPPLRGLAARVVEVVVAPDSDALLRALVLPARQFGYQFEDIALARRMVEAAEGANAALPLLSFCADRLWDARDRKWRRITIDAYLALGGVEGALASHAERTLAALTPAQQDAARALLVRMVTPEGTRAVVRRAELAGAARTADGAAPDALLVLDRLVDARLLVVREADDQAGGATVELVHEALLHHWSRLSAWLLADREGRARALALTQAARAWDARGRPRGLLWRDDVLADHRARDKRARLPLGALEASFLSASEDEERRERRASRRLAATGFGVVSLLALFLFVLWQRASSARFEERRAREDATLALAVAQAGRLAAEAASRESLGRPGEAVALLRAARTVLGEQDPGMRRKLAADLDRLDGLGAAALVLRGDAAPVADVAFSPDGVRLAAAIGDAARVWDVAGEAAGGEPTTLRHEGPVWQLAFSPDGLRIATASADRTVRVWDARTGARIATLAHPSPVRCLAFSPDGARLATGAADGAVRVFDDPNALPRVLLAHGGAVHALAFHANDAVASASADRTVRLWDLASQAAPRALGPHDEPVSTIAVSRTGGALLAVQRGGVSLWDLATSTQRARLGGQDRAVYGAAFSPDGAHVVTASSDRVAQVWSAATGAALATLGGHERAVQRAVYSSDGARIATASSDGTARLWDARSHVLLRVLRGHQGALSTLTFSPDGARLAIGSKAEDGVVRVFATASGARARPLLGHGDDVYAAVFSPDGARVATSSKDRTARLWDARSGALLAILPHREQVYALSFSPDGSVVATASHDRTARLWDARTGRPIATLSGHEGYLPALAFSPRGDVLATASVDRTTRLWDVRTATLRSALPAQEGAVFALAFSRDGAALSTLADDGTVSFWDAASGALRGRQPVPSGYAEAAGSGAGLVAFGASDGTTLVWDVATSARLASLPGSASLLGVAVSSDGSRLVTGGADRVARVYALPGAVPIAPLVGHDAGVLAVAASPDGRLAATGSADRTVRVWRADEGRLLQVLGGHDDKVTAVAFSPDGRHVVSASQDDTARVWDVDVEHDPESVARRAGDATNLRVCRGTLEVVPVIPRPAADSVWADASSCASP